MLGPQRRLLRAGESDRHRHGLGAPSRPEALSAVRTGGRGRDDPKRLAKRLERYRDSLFTFLDRPEADWTNTFAERQIRPAVILRKNSQCNRSEKGAATHALLMSVYRTLKLRGHDPRQAIEEALRTYCGTGTLPPLPDPVATRN